MLKYIIAKHNLKEKKMKYSIKKQDSVVTATFTVSAEEWAEAMEQAYQKNKSK